MQDTCCGLVGIIGRPNVGKSTLLNKILGQKVSITSHKPQTTRHRLLGIKTEQDHQAIYVDTPGLHRRAERVLNRYMNRVALTVMQEVDVLVWLVTALKWHADDEWVLQQLQKLKCPIILAVNKVDTVQDKALLLPYIEMLRAKKAFTEIIPLSAKNGTNVAELEHVITHHLPAGPFLFPAEQLTDRNDRFLTSEIIREQLLRRLHQEVPYGLTVMVDQFKLKKRVLHIAATIYVEKDSQKKIVIGKDGAQLREIGTRARLQLEKIFSNKIFLQLWVKVRPNWADDERALQRLGYEE